MKNIAYILAGLFFGFVLIKSEAVSWYRIVEMFHLQSFHMLGVIGTAVAVGAASLLIIKKLGLQDKEGKPLQPKEKPKDYRANLLGGIFFGMGWAIVGACPGPLYVHLGTGNLIILIPIISVLAGVILYGLVRKKLPR
jgi:uncharacterized membrane protein YedE/YeeE